MGATMPNAGMRVVVPDRLPSRVSMPRFLRAVREEGVCHLSIRKFLHNKSKWRPFKAKILEIIFSEN
jgi:hypothetical protein